MSAFVGSFITYVIEMVCMVILGLCGGYIGIRLRKRKMEQSGEGGAEQ